jgi:hypothetical protein
VSARRGDSEPDVRTLRGWRRELVGAELLELLAGRRQLGVVRGRVTVSPGHGWPAFPSERGPDDPRSRPP